MTDRLPGGALADPYGCFWCAYGERSHALRWAGGVGWHTWAEPPQNVIKNRMFTRRENAS